MHNDLRFAFRSLKKSPVFTAVALAVLALAIGAGTAVFSIVDAVVFRGLPFPAYDRLVAVLEHDPTRPTTFGGGMTTPQTYLDWRRDQKSFQSLAAFQRWQFRVRNERGEPDRARALRVSWEFFPTLGVAPILGRAFAPEDEILGRHRSVILSYGFWQRQFGGSPEAVGMTLQLDEETWEVIGVMPRGFSYPVAAVSPTEIYLPLALRDQDKVRGSARNYQWTVVGRLKDGVALEQAHEQMNALAAALDAQYPKWSQGRRARVTTLLDQMVGRVRDWMLMLLATVGLVLLIACTNVANLLLARATARTREMAVRAALGASRARLLRGLLVESVTLSLMGAAIGTPLAYGAVQVLRAWLPPQVPRVSSIDIDGRVLAAAVAAAVITGVLFGILPALRSSRSDLLTALRDGGRSATTGVAGQRLRNGLVIAEVSLAVLLLVGTGLFTASFAELLRVEPGFDYRNLLTLSVGVPVKGNDYAEAMQRGGPYLQQVLEAVGGVPGVESASAVSGGVPLSGGWSQVSVSLPERGKLEGEGDALDRRQVTPGYLSTLRVPLLRGRYLTEQDRMGSQPVLLLNEAAAHKYWPGEDALGKRITINQTELTVAGVVGNIRHLGPEAPIRLEGYLPIAQTGVIGADLVIRTHGDPLPVLPAVKAAIWRINPDQLLSADTVTLEAYRDRLIAHRRFLMALLALFGLLGLVIAAAGVYAVMACVVEQRTHEIGVRMALGATPRGILVMVLQRATAVLAAGLAIGAVAASYLAGVVRAFLFQIQPHDIRIFVLAVGTLALAGWLASMAPARRAAKVDPMVALRQE